jgi:hypothetical protein
LNCSAPSILFTSPLWCIYIRSKLSSFFWENFNNGKSDRGATEYGFM